MRIIFIASILIISKFCTGQNTFPATGNVGIGITTPTSILDVFSISSITKVQVRSGGGNPSILEINGSGLIGALESVWSPTTSETRVGCRSNYPLSLFSNNVDRVTILTNGNVGIGTRVPGTYMLAVAGKIAASAEVRVFDINTTSFPDYVFEPGYLLPELEQTEQFIKEHGHLSEVPTAAEVARDGMSLNEMNIILLKKVEELTLYMIQLKKEYEALSLRLGKIENK